MIPSAEESPDLRISPEVISYEVEVGEDSPIQLTRELLPDVGPLIDPFKIAEDQDAAVKQAVQQKIDAVAANLARKEQEIAERRQDIANLDTEMETLRANSPNRADLERRSSKPFVKFKSKLGIHDKQTTQIQIKIDETTASHAALWSQQDSIRFDLQFKEADQASMPTPQDLVAEHHAQMSGLPLSQEQKQQVLRPEVLSGLSSDDYIKLWRRLNPFVLTHVTRQGFRDHNAMVYHSAGMEEYKSGLITMLADGHALRPPLAVHGLKDRSEASVQAVLAPYVLLADSEEEANQRFTIWMYQQLASAPKYPDKTAVHFASQDVMNEYYGGETRNEAFIIYPSDFIAANYSYGFNGFQNGFVDKPGDVKWNDIFVWPESVDEPGLPIDAGFVFLPNDTPVDPLTGSVYASALVEKDGIKTRVMIANEPLIRKFTDWWHSESVQQKRMTYHEQSASRSGVTSPMLLDRDTLAKNFAQELERAGFDSDIVATLGRGAAMSLMWTNEANAEVLLGEILRKTDRYWQKAAETVPAKDYWEMYFTAHPEQRPKHIYYYDGDPTEAVSTFLANNKIGSADVSDIVGPLLGFDKNHVADMEHDPRSNSGREELLVAAHKIIAAKYSPN